MNHHKKSICLIGLPSVGKSTVAKEIIKNKNLARFQLLDTDEVIKQKQDASNLEFLLTNKDQFFSLQKTVVQEIDFTGNLLISTGGAIIYDDEGMRYLSENCLIIYLKSSIEVCLKRLRDSPKPIFIPSGASLYDTLTAREVLYQKWAHKTVVADQKSLEQICLEIVGYINTELVLAHH